MQEVGHCGTHKTSNPPRRQQERMIVHSHMLLMRFSSGQLDFMRGRKVTQSIEFIKTDASRGLQKARINYILWGGNNGEVRRVGGMDWRRERKKGERRGGVRKEEERRGGRETKEWQRGKERGGNADGHVSMGAQDRFGVRESCITAAGQWKGSVKMFKGSVLATVE